MKLNYYNTQKYCSTQSILRTTIWYPCDIWKYVLCENVMNISTGHESASARIIPDSQ